MRRIFHHPSSLSLCRTRLERGRFAAIIELAIKSTGIHAVEVRCQTIATSSSGAGTFAAVAPVVATRNVVTFRITPAVADQTPVRGAIGELRYHMGVEVGWVQTVILIRAAQAAIVISARRLTALRENGDSHGSKKRRRNTVM